MILVTLQYYNVRTYIFIKFQMFEQERMTMIHLSAYNTYYSHFYLMLIKKKKNTYASSSCFIFENSSFVMVPSPSPSLCNFSLDASKSGLGGAGGIFKWKKAIT